MLSSLAPYSTQLLIKELTPIFLPRENPVDRGTWWAAVYGIGQGRTPLKQLSMHACIGEVNGNPLQYSLLENPRDRGAWWAAVCGVAEGWA